MLRVRWVVVVALVGAVGSGRAGAESAESQVERLAAEAVNAYKGADYNRAVELLQKAYEIRQERAGKVLEAAKRVKAVEDALKAHGSWHSMARYQIISYANPTKRARKPADFDKQSWRCGRATSRGSPRRRTGATDTSRSSTCSAARYATSSGTTRPAHRRRSC